MIPLRLTLKNFMCYRDDAPTLDLESIHVACLCGDNGHGKTALLDAIAWALWGKARARTQEEIIHQGLTDVYVELDFLSRGQRYRVIRRHSRSGRVRQGAALLELQLLTDNRATPLTGGVTRETQAHVNDLIHMDYETFINTAFLKQGDADRFTTSTPSKRKETLAEVLDLSRYEKLETRAREHSRAAEIEAAGVDRETAWRKRETEGRREHEKNLAATNAALERVTREAAAQRKEVDRLRSSVQFLHRRRSELADVHSALSSKRSDVGRLQAQLQGFASRIGDYESTAARETDIRRNFAELQRLRDDRDLLDKALHRRTELDAERFRIEKEIAVRRERLSSEAAQLRTLVEKELRPRADSLGEIDSRTARLALDEAAAAERREALERCRGESRMTADRMRDLDAEKDRIRSQMEDTRRKFDMLERGDSLCPLCSQTLGPDGKEHLRKEYEALGREGRTRYDENRNEDRALRHRHQNLESTLKRGEAELVETDRRIQRGKAALENDRAAALKASAEIDRTTEELERRERAIAAGDFAHEERKLLETINADLSALGYDPERHTRVRESARALEPYDELRRKMLEALSRLPEEREALASTQEMLRRLNQEIADAERSGEALQQELADLPAREAGLDDAEAQAAELDADRSSALKNQAVLEQQISRAVELERELKAYERERRRLEREKSIYDELARAFGKNGVQAMIIETAIPQLETDSNEILKRLTENRMTLKLQLQRGRMHRGQPSEELDVRIADEVGTRSYETFSGGEAFRINFALRIALSKLLARRAGAPLPILFIDEGFGSQDSAGQERLIEAIRSIQNDFQKIIVITHVEQIKEAFPVRIEVTKTEMGSSFAVV